MQISRNFSLKPFNTFNIDATADAFCTVKSVEEILEILDWRKKKGYYKTLILGGGSNILFTQSFNGLVIKNEIGGVEKIREDEECVYIKAGAGVNWHSLVMLAIENNWAGLENLSLIPGNTGASPMQNIGAYGVEIKDVFHELEAMHLPDHSMVVFDKEACKFGYRESIFKHQYKDQFIITSVTFRLNKHPTFHTSYGAIEEELKRMNIQTLSIKAISQAVINIRSSKLPNPAVIGNAGSFFKNPEIERSAYLHLQQQFPSIVAYPLENGNVKIAAGWLIEHAGWKGYRDGDAGCHEKQALVLVNHGNATGHQLLHLSERIIQSVQQKYGIALQREVNIV